VAARWCVPPPGGVTEPKLIKGAKPNYTPESMKAKVQGRCSWRRSS